MDTLARKMKPVHVLLVLFATMVVLGLLWGGFGKVLANGILVCLDCIGII